VAPGAYGYAIASASSLASSSRSRVEKMGFEKQEALNSSRCSRRVECHKD
jgi:hypothetical protein